MVASISMNPSSKIPLVQKLNTTNYNSWSEKMEFVLILNDYLIIINRNKYDPRTSNRATEFLWK